MVWQGRGPKSRGGRNCDAYEILADDKVEPVPQADFAPGVVWVTPRLRKTNDRLLPLRRNRHSGGDIPA